MKTLVLMLIVLVMALGGFFYYKRYKNQQEMIEREIQNRKNSHKSVKVNNTKIIIGGVMKDETGNLILINDNVYKKDDIFMVGEVEVKVGVIEDHGAIFILNGVEKKFEINEPNLSIDVSKFK